MSKPFERVASLLLRCGTGEAILPPTGLYNEGWLLSLVLDWFACHPGERYWRHRACRAAQRAERVLRRMLEVEPSSGEPPACLTPGSALA